MWRVVVADSRSPRDGRSIETVGRYNAQTSPSQIVIDADRVRHWLERGAQPSGTVKKLLRSQGLSATGVPLAGGPRVPKSAGAGDATTHVPTDNGTAAPVPVSESSPPESAAPAPAPESEAPAEVADAPGGESPVDLAAEPAAGAPEPGARAPDRAAEIPADAAAGSPADAAETPADPAAQALDDLPAEARADLPAEAPTDPSSDEESDPAADGTPPQE